MNLRYKSITFYYTISILLHHLNFYTISRYNAFQMCDKVFKYFNTVYQEFRKHFNIN